jgi:hypothetical protein
MPRVGWHHSDLGLKLSTRGRLLRELLHTSQKPLLYVDIDGVLSLFGFRPDAIPHGCSWHQVDGIVHLLSHEAAGHLHALQDVYELVWCSGWKDRANDHLPHVLRVGPYPYLTFADPSAGHWKLAAVIAHAQDRPLAWIDDDVNDAVRTWAAQRPTPTLIVETAPATGLTAPLAQRLRDWAKALHGTSRTD